MDGNNAEFGTIGLHRGSGLDGSKHGRGYTLDSDRHGERHRPRGRKWSREAAEETEQYTQVYLPHLRQFLPGNQGVKPHLRRLHGNDGCF